MIAGSEKALINSASSRYFGFVVGSATPTSVVADWLTTIWDQNAQVYSTSPAASIVEDIVSRWILDLLSLPNDAGIGYVSGTQMGNFTALTAARNFLLKKYGWDVNENGLQDAPRMNIVCGACCHATVHSAIRLMGLGTKNIRLVDADQEGRMEVQALRRVLAECIGLTIVCVQTGNVNTGAFDPISDIAEQTKEYGAWLHVDGAFGLWACASPRFKSLVAGIEKADSWATDAHKLLNVPYDSGIMIIRNREAHKSIKITRCAYANSSEMDSRDGTDWVPENSRRARGFVLYAALRNLGRNGVTRLVENTSDMAGLFAARLTELPYVSVLNDVVLNQVLFRLEPEHITDFDAFNASVALRIQKEGVCWLGTTRWRDQTVLRISVSNYSTTRDDVCKSIDSIIDLVEKELKSHSY